MSRTKPKMRLTSVKPPIVPTFLTRLLMARTCSPAPDGPGAGSGLADRRRNALGERSEEHTSELQSLMRISYAVFCLNKKNQTSTTFPKHRTRNQYANTTRKRKHKPNNTRH